jgi:transposase-like protein
LSPRVSAVISGKEPTAMDSLVNIQSLVDDARCFETVRHLRWPEGVQCPQCGSDQVARHGHDERQRDRQRYRCLACQARFDDLTDTIFAGHHQPLRLWILCLYFMGLNLSNQQIARELDLNVGDVQAMTEQLRAGIRAARPAEVLEGIVECDESWNATKCMSRPAIKASRRRWRKKSPGAPARAEGHARPRHLGEREAADLRHGPA